MATEVFSEKKEIFPKEEREKIFQEEQKDIFQKILEERKEVMDFPLPKSLPYGGLFIIPEKYKREMLGLLNGKEKSCIFHY